MNNGSTSNARYVYWKTGEAEQKISIHSQEFLVENLDFNTVYHCKIVADVDGYGQMQNEEYLFKTGVDEAELEQWTVMKQVWFNGKQMDILSDANTYVDAYLAESYKYFQDKGMGGLHIEVNGNAYQISPRSGDSLWIDGDSLSYASGFITEFRVEFPSNIYDIGFSQVSEQLFKDSTFGDFEVNCEDKILTLKNNVRL